MPWNASGYNTGKFKVDNIFQKLCEEGMIEKSKGYQKEK